MFPFLNSTETAFWTDSHKAAESVFFFFSSKGVTKTPVGCWFPLWRHKWQNLNFTEERATEAQPVLKKVFTLALDELEDKRFKECSFSPPWESCIAAVHGIKTVSPKALILETNILCLSPELSDRRETIIPLEVNLLWITLCLSAITTQHKHIFCVTFISLHCRPLRSERGYTLSVGEVARVKKYLTHAFQQLIQFCCLSPTGPCLAGYWCKEGASSPSPLDGLAGLLCPPGQYCPSGCHLVHSFRHSWLISDVKNTLFSVSRCRCCLFRAANAKYWVKRSAVRIRDDSA